MKALCKNLLSFILPEEVPRREEELLVAEIEKTREKIEYAWNRLDYASPDYVELAVLELLLVETHYGILLRRYRLMLGMIDGASSFRPSTVKLLSNISERNYQTQLLSQNLH